MLGFWRKEALERGINQAPAFFEGLLQHEGAV